jgi:hypothetical protein
VSHAKSFDEIITYFKSILERFPDKRTGKNKRYQIVDVALSAFSVFFTQTPSFLAHQRTMEQNKGRNNAKSLFGVEKIPTDNHIRDLMDEVEPSLIYPVFTEILRVLEHYFPEFRSFNHNLLVAMDGTEYHDSTKISCPHCSSRVLKNGITQHFHSVVTPVIVCPNHNKVIPLVPEFIVPQDGHEKQDCETAAAKRWVNQYGDEYAPKKVTILGDDLYSRQPFCQLLLEKHLNFILVCKPDSHKTTYDYINGMTIDTVSVKYQKGKVYEIYTYRFVNQIPIRDGDDALLINWCELTITNSADKIIFKNAFATNHLITKSNVQGLVAAGRARWKVENENNNTLKTKGYHLEHNFGHGQKHLSALLATFNILSFLFHTLLDITDKKYQLIRQNLPSRQTFFDDLRALTRYMFFDSWNNLLDFMILGLELEFPPP